jgi:uncharacterized membrane protein
MAERHKEPTDLSSAGASSQEPRSTLGERSAAELRMMQRIETYRSGPLPDPQALRAYAELIPNGAERIMSLVEHAARHRHNQEASETMRSARGQWMAFVLTLVLTATGLFLGATGHDWLAAGLFTTTLSAVVAIFALGRRTQASDDKK